MQVVVKAYEEKGWRWPCSEAAPTWANPGSVGCDRSRSAPRHQDCSRQACADATPNIEHRYRSEADEQRVPHPRPTALQMSAGWLAVRVPQMDWINTLAEASTSAPMAVRLFPICEAMVSKLFPSRTVGLNWADVS